MSGRGAGAVNHQDRTPELMLGGPWYRVDPGRLLENHLAIHSSGPPPISARACPAGSSGREARGRGRDRRPAGLGGLSEIPRKTKIQHTSADAGIVERPTAPVILTSIASVLFSAAGLLFAAAILFSRAWLNFCF